MTILITGGFGYVGGRIAQALGKSGDRFLRLATHRPHVARPAWLESGEVVHLDLSRRDSLQKACASVDCIIHLAALNEIESAEDPGRAFLINSLGTQQLLDAAIAAKVGRFVYFSTAHVYGAPLVGMITEKTVPRPTHPYSITHKAAEDWVLSAHDRRQIQGVVLRLSNSFGAPADPAVNRWTLIVNDLCKQAVTTQKMVLRSSGVQQRDFIAMADVCRAVQHVLELGADPLDDGLFNLGGECALPVIAMASRIADCCEATLGFRPEILRPEPAAGEKSTPLEYRIDKLKTTGFGLSGNMTLEINETLQLCHACR